MNNAINSNDAIVNLLKQNNGQALDDHNGQIRTFPGCGRFKDRKGVEHVVPVYDNTPYCINPFVLDDGEVCLSRGSVGGGVYPKNGREGAQAAAEELGVYDIVWFSEQD